MKISDIMSKDTVFIKLDTPLQEAAEKMEELDIGSLPVTDGEKIKGMLTDRDIVIRALAAGKDPATTPASAVMTEKIKYVFDDQDVSEAVDTMKDLQIRRLVVLDRNKNLVGFVSMGDVCSKSDDVDLTAGVAKCVSEPPEKHSKHRSSKIA